MTDYWSTVYRRTWKGSVVNSFMTPLLYIVAMGVLLGGFIKGDPAKLEGATSYLAFVAPGMLAAQAMTTVFGEVTYPVMAMIKWQRTFYGMIASPLEIADVVLAHLGFVLFRVGTVCGVFTLVMAPFGVFESWWGDRRGLLRPAADRRWPSPPRSTRSRRRCATRAASA